MADENLIAHYQNLLKKHGPSAKAVQWSDSDTQFKRFDILTGITENLGSVLDVGCGLGALYFYLRNKGHSSKYLGIDIVPEFVNIALDAMREDDNASVSVVEPGQRLPDGFDWVILSGVFNNRVENNRNFMLSTIKEMFNVARKGIAFNAMSSHVDYQTDDLFHINPIEIFDYCKAVLGGHPVLRHDYTLRPGGFPYEFSVYVYKEPQRH